MKKLITVVMVASMSASLWAVQGRITTQNDSKEGEIKWQSRSKSYLVSVKVKGGRTVDMELPLKDVVRLDIAEPAGFAKAKEAVERGQGAGAVSVLSKIVQDYKMLKWDKIAGRYLVEAYLSANNAQKAFEVASAIVAEDKDSAWRGAIAPAYWQTLLKLGKTSQLETYVKKAAMSGDRPASAEALIMRGDMILAAKAGPEGFRDALSQAYLRVALMYADEDCKSARYDAMMRAATCFDRLGQAARAENLRSQAKSL